MSICRLPVDLACILSTTWARVSRAVRAGSHDKRSNANHVFELLVVKGPKEDVSRQRFACGATNVIRYTLEGLDTRLLACNAAHHEVLARVVIPCARQFLAQLLNFMSPESGAVTRPPATDQRRLAWKK